MTTSIIDPTAAVTDVAGATVISEPTLFKTDRGWNINVAALAKQARDDLSSVQSILVPAQVRKHRRHNLQFETPTLSEVGGGVGHDYCQVVAGTDGRPVSIDNVIHVHSDPARSSFTHGCASVEIGSYFACGWKVRADSVILLYEVVAIGELQGKVRTDSAVSSSGGRKDRDDRLVAKLTCELAGYSIATWRGTQYEVPPNLVPLYDATEQRLKRDVEVPFYMDVLRMTRPTDETRQIAAQMKVGGTYELRQRSAESFMDAMFEEVIDIRSRLYAQLSPSAEQRKVEQVKGVATLTLNAEQDQIELQLTLLRNDDTFPQTLQTILTRHNFITERGRMAVERGLVLNCTSYDRLSAELKQRNRPVVEVQLTCIR